jgi:uncharacterized protein (TIGR03083 family)
VAGNDVWPTIDVERKALAADLAGIPDDAWDTPSLSSPWTVRDVVAHMTATSMMTGPKFFAKLAGSGFRLTRLQAKDITRERGNSPADALARFTTRVDSRGRPPGPPQTMLGEVIVHAEDIRRPLGISHTYPTDACAQVAEFYAGSNLIIGGKRRVTGLALRATDTDWSHGSGPAVSGPILDLVLAITGRRAALDNVKGDGVDKLRSQF